MIINIYKKETEKGTRWFAETDDHFENANGFGYTTRERLMNAYGWFERNYNKVIERWDRQTLRQMELDNII